jgi:hypothetical protein
MLTGTCRRDSFQSGQHIAHGIKIRPMAQYEVSTRGTMPRKPSTVFGQGHGTFNPETHVVCGWNKLLNELHLTEEAALLAVATNDKLGIKLRVFARRVHRARYVPEDVLTLLNLSRGSGNGSLAIRNLRRGDADAE